MILLFKRKELVLVGITYYIPDYTNILNEFYWQTEDFVPDIPRVHRFLEHWHKNINATIKEVQIRTSSNQRLTFTNFDGKLN
jgi:uncharacterized protein Usg